MKKVVTMMLTLATVASMMTSCKKEQTPNGMQFHATMEQCTDIHNPKTVLDGTQLKWVSGDMITIYSNSQQANYVATPGNPATTATFSYYEGDDITDFSNIIATYPAYLLQENNKVYLPHNIMSEDGSLVEFPMYAQSSNNELHFKNLCGVLKLHLQKANTTITQITLRVNYLSHHLWGWFTPYISSDGEDIELWNTGEHEDYGLNRVVMHCNQSIDQGHDFYFGIPADEYSGLMLEIVTSDGMRCTKGPASSTVVIERSKYSTLTLTGNDLVFNEPVGAVNGLFTINNQNDQVRFSQGNLNYYDGTWGIPLYQHESGGIFGWGTGDNPLTTHSSINDYSEWGNNTITFYEDITTGWRTLTKEEWNYILFERPGAASKRGFATVMNTVPGLLLLPDDSDEIINTDCSSWTDNEFRRLDIFTEYVYRTGIVFLPAVVNRNGSIIGGFWTSTPYTPGGTGIEENNAWYVGFGPTLTDPIGILTTPINDQLSVRLVKDAQ